MPTPTIKGTFTTIRWGDGGVTMPTAINVAIVNSIRISRLGGEPIKIEDSDGFTAVVVGLEDGERVEMELIDNTALTWPGFMDVVQWQGPNDGSSVDLLVVDEGVDLAKKREGMRTLVFERYAGIDLTP